MDWQLAISRNREALLVIIVALMKSVGLVDGGMLTTLPRLLYARALAIIRPAESALRRLIMIAAHEMALRGVGHRKQRTSTTDFTQLGSRQHAHVSAFSLIDPLKNFGSEPADFAVLDVSLDSEQSNPESARMSAVMLARRILTLKKALESIPVQAKRLARWYGQRDLALQHYQPHRLSPLRPGLPIGLPRRNRNEVQVLLRECHLLALYSNERRDSS
jgi:hypothetical protein